MDGLAAGHCRLTAGTQHRLLQVKYKQLSDYGHMDGLAAGHCRLTAGTQHRLLQVKYKQLSDYGHMDGLAAGHCRLTAGAQHRLLQVKYEHLSVVLCIRNDLFRIRIQLRIFRVSDPAQCPCFKAYLNIIKKSTLNFIKMKNLPTICHLLFHTTVLQYSVQN